MAALASTIGRIAHTRELLPFFENGKDASRKRIFTLQDRGQHLRWREGVAPKTKSKTFTAAEVRRAIEKALDEVSGAAKSLSQSDALRVQQRPDGRFEVKRPGAKRASAVKATQTEAIARAREIEPGKAPIAKRVRKKPGTKRGTWRET